MKKAYFNWSSGKDSALALYKALQSGIYDVQALFNGTPIPVTPRPIFHLYIVTPSAYPALQIYSFSHKPMGIC